MSKNNKEPFHVKTANNLLLVEGINDCYVVANLCEQHKLAKVFEIHNCKGHNEALDNLEVRIQSSENPKIIGIVLDADQPKDNPSVNSRLEAIQARLFKVCADYQTPQKINTTGWIIPNTDIYPKIGIWLMPNNSDIGMLENFLMELAKEKHEACLEFAQQCVDKVKENKLSTFRPVQHAKAVIHTYLAWHDEPGDTLGKAIKASNIDAHAPLAIDFMNWLKELFEIYENE